MKNRNLNRSRQSERVRQMVIAAMLSAIVAVLTFTPIGMIPLPPPLPRRLSSPLRRLPSTSTSPLPPIAIAARASSRGWPPVMSLWFGSESWQPPTSSVSLTT